MDAFNHAGQAPDKTYCPELPYGVEYLKLEKERPEETEAIEELLKRKPPGTKQLDEKSKQEEGPKAGRDGQEGKANP
jgi:hypothetical protein